MDMSFSKFREIVKDREAWYAAVHGITESDTTERLHDSNMTQATFILSLPNLVCVWHLLHISVWTSHVSSAHWPPMTSGCHRGQQVML